jgi:hypothetical protein
MSDPRRKDNYLKGEKRGGEIALFKKKFSMLRWRDAKEKLQRMRKGTTTQFAAGRREKGEIESS